MDKIEYFGRMSVAKRKCKKQTYEDNQDKKEKGYQNEPRKY